MKVEYAHGITSVCLKDFDDEVVDEDVILVYDEVVADDALVESLKAYLATWTHGCSVRHVLDHWERSRDRFKGSGRNRKFVEWVTKYEGFTTFDYQGQVSISLV